MLQHLTSMGRDSVITDPFLFADDLGPAKVVHLTERSTGLRAVVVIDNVAAGPAIGGTRHGARRRPWRSASLSPGP